MSEEIIKVLDYITEKLGVDIDWTAENAMPYIEEIIGKYATYNIVRHSLGVAIGLLMILSLFLMKRIVRGSRLKCEKTKETTFFYYFSPFSKEVELDEFPLMLIITSCVLLGAGGFVLLLLNVDDLIRWSIIPEIALLEELQTLMS